MTDVDVMEPAALVEVFAAIDCRRFGARLQVLAAIGAYPWGVTLSRSVAAKAWGMSEGAFREATKQLVDDRVIFRDAASGRRAHTYRVNPNVFEWANVPWRVDAEVVWHRVHSQLDPLAMFHGELDQPTTGERTPVAARAARATNARSRAGSGHFSAESGRSRAGSPRGYGTTAGASRAGSPRDKTSVAARAARAATTPGALGSSPSALESVKPPSLPREEDLPLPDGYDEVEWALMAHTRSGFCAESQQRKIAAIVRHHSAATVLAVIPTIPNDRRLPSAIEWVGRACDNLTTADASDEPQHEVLDVLAARRRRLAEQIAGAEAQLRNWRSATVDLDDDPAIDALETELEDLRSQLAACETGPANVTTGGTQ